MKSVEERRSGQGERRSGPSQEKKAPGGMERRKGVLGDRRTDQNLHLVTFFINGQHFGIELSKAQEIVSSQPMTAIPTADEHFAGLINLRGQIVTAIDLRLLLGFEPLENRDSLMNLVIQYNGDTSSLLFDSVGDVLEVAPHNVEAPPRTLALNLSQYVQAVVKLESHLLMLLNIDAIVDKQKGNKEGIDSVR